MYLRARIRDFIERAVFRFSPLILEECLALVATRTNTPVNRITIHTEGWNNLVLCVGTQYAFRFPRSHCQAAYLRAEHRFLNAFSPLAPLSVPRSQLLTDPRIRFPFMRYDYIAGTPLTIERIKKIAPRGQQTLAAQLGNFLTRLHSFPLSHARSLGVAHYHVRRQEQKEIRNARIHTLPLLHIAERDWIDRALAAWHRYCQSHTFPSAVVHADLKEGHILFDPPSLQLSGIIDFGDIHLDDPALDFSSLMRYGELFVQDALAAYTQPVDPELLSRARFYEQRERLFVLTYFLMRKQTRHIEEALASLRRFIATHAPWTP